MNTPRPSILIQDRSMLFQPAAEPTHGPSTLESHTTRGPFILGLFRAQPEPPFEMLTTPAQAIIETYRAKKASEDLAAAKHGVTRSFPLRACEDAQARRSQDHDLLDEISDLELSILRGDQAQQVESTESLDIQDMSQDVFYHKTTSQDMPDQGAERDNAFTVWGYKFPTIPPPESAHVHPGRNPREKDSFSLISVSSTEERARVRHPSFGVHRSCLPELQDARFDAIVMSSFAGNACYDGLKYKCARPYCREVLPTLRSLTYHLHMHDEVVDSWSSIGNPIFCDDCARCFDYKHDLLVHRCRRLAELRDYRVPPAAESPVLGIWGSIASSFASCLPWLAKPNRQDYQ